MTHQFRFGVVAEHVQSPSEWIAKAQRAEEYGYSSFLVPHHLKLSPLVPLMAAASATSSIKIGGFVFNIDFIKDPVFWASEAASLDQFSGGRLELGIGPGYARDEYLQAGIPFDTAGTRISRFEEGLHIIKALLQTTDPVQFTGTYYSVDHRSARPQPLQKPYPPIYIGGGARRILSIAAREADIVGIVPRNSAAGLESASITAEATAQKIEWVRQAAEERFPHLELSAMVFHVAVTEADQLKVAHGVSMFLKQHLFAPGQSASPQEILGSPHFLIGSVSQICDVLQEQRERYGISYFEVLEKDLDNFAPIVAALAGK